MVPELAAMLTETVQHAVCTGTDDYGQLQFDVPHAHAARVQYRQRRIRTAQGEERMSTTTVFFNTDIVLRLQDQLILPDGTAPAVQVVARVQDEYGQLDHVEAYL